MITTCTRCGGLYEAGSEEQANELERFCLACRRAGPGGTEPADDGSSTLPSFLPEMLFQARTVAELLHEFTRDVQAGVQPGFSSRTLAVLRRTEACLVQIREQVHVALGSLARAGIDAPASPASAAGITNGVAERALAVTGAAEGPSPSEVSEFVTRCPAEPPLLVTGPGGNFRTEHRPCAGCKALFTAPADSPGTLCGVCVDYRKEVCT